MANAKRWVVAVPGWIDPESSNHEVVLASDYDALRQTLYDLVRSHNGYHMGVGPCICAAHENARKLLGISRDDPMPAGLSDNGDGNASR